MDHNLSITHKLFVGDDLLGELVNDLRKNPMIAPNHELRWPLHGGGGTLSATLYDVNNEFTRKVLTRGGQGTYFVFNPDGEKPKVRQPNLDKADAEAQRIAKLMPGKEILVLRAVRSYTHTQLARKDY